MDIHELKGIRRNLDRYLRRFAGCIKTAPSRRHMRRYVGGQISDLERKNVEQIALDAGVPPRTLQEFLEFYVWDEDQVRMKMQKIIMRDYASDDAIAVVDETSYAKKGEKTAGVQRQYCGSTGKRDNCVVSVDLAYATQDFHCLADADLYLPENTWSKDRERCRSAGIPDDVVYRPKWKIALEMLGRSTANGMKFKWLTADEEYGRCSMFRQGVEALGMTYVVEIPCDTMGWTKMPRVIAPPPYTGRGRPNVRTHLAPSAPVGRRVDQLWKRGGPSWQMYHVKDTEKGPVVWEVRATRFHTWSDRLPAAQEWLLVARNVHTEEIKYFLSNAPVDTSIEAMLSVAFTRWRVERAFEDAKGEVGLDHFEVRKYRPLMRHLVLSMVSLLFLMKETKRLREKKSVVEPSAGAKSRRGAA